MGVNGFGTEGGGVVVQNKVSLNLSVRKQAQRVHIKDGKRDRGENKVN